MSFYRKIVMCDVIPSKAEVLSPPLKFIIFQLLHILKCFISLLLPVMKNDGVSSDISTTILQSLGIVFHLGNWLPVYRVWLCLDEPPVILRSLPISV